MKKIFVFAALLAIAASCIVSETDTIKGTAPEITASYERTLTKTTLITDEEGVGTIWWNPADEINVFYGTTSTHYTSKNIENATTVAFGTSDIIGSIESVQDNLWGLYPYDEYSVCDGVSVTTTISANQRGVVGTFDDDAFTSLAHSTSTAMTFYNVLGGIKFSLSRDDIHSITFKGINDENIVGKVKLTMDDNDRPVAEIVDGEKIITLTPKEGDTFASGVNYYIVMLPTVMSNGFTMTFETETAIGIFEYTEKPIAIKRSVFAKKENIDGYAEFSLKSMPEPEYIDLGLSVMWATYNVGAAKPEDYGGYYQWAGTKDVRSTGIYLDWSNCPYYDGSDIEGWTKYIPSNLSSYWSGTGDPDNKTVLDPEDDIAHVVWGDNWRIPTRGEWESLKNNCSWTWTIMNGINGYKVQSKKSGYTGNWIFLPAASTRERNFLSYLGSNGGYWSSSLYKTNPFYASNFSFDSDYSSVYSACERYYGLSVRPVYACSHVLEFFSGRSPSVGEPGWKDLYKCTECGMYYEDAKRAVCIGGQKEYEAWKSEGGRGYLYPLENHECVDLGLSVKWATCNVGASNPEDYGGYYQWAGIQNVYDTSIYLDWSNCPYHTGSDYKTGWTKYVSSDKSSYWSGTNSPDNKTVLDYWDDVAVRWGGSWRMPIDEEWEELANTSNCYWTWTSINGINGYKVQSRKSGYTDNWIFLPAAGYRCGGTLLNVESYGNYWSSHLSEYYPFYAYGMSFSSKDIRWYNSSYRYFGQSVRPVSE